MFCGFTERFVWCAPILSYITSQPCWKSTACNCNHIIDYCNQMIAWSNEPCFYWKCSTSTKNRKLETGLSPHPLVSFCPLQVWFSPVVYVWSVPHTHSTTTTAFACIFQCFFCQQVQQSCNSSSASPDTNEEPCPTDMVKMTKSKTFQAYLPSCHRTYSCIHCRAHLANHDELISKVGQLHESNTHLPRVLPDTSYLTLSWQAAVMATDWWGKSIFKTHCVDLFC